MRKSDGDYVGPTSSLKLDINFGDHNQWPVFRALKTTAEMRAASQKRDTALVSKQGGMSHNSFGNETVESVKLGPIWNTQEQWQVAIHLINYAQGLLRAATHPEPRLPNGNEFVFSFILTEWESVLLPKHDI